MFRTIMRANFSCARHSANLTIPLNTHKTYKVGSVINPRLLIMKSHSLPKVIQVEISRISNWSHVFFFYFKTYSPFFLNFFGLCMYESI